MSILDRYNNGWINDSSLFDFLSSLSNIEIGGKKIYDGLGTHLMQNPKEFEDLIHFLLRTKFDFGLDFNRFLEFGWSTGISHTILTKTIKFKESVAVDLAVPSGINTNTFLANLRFKDLIFIANDSTSDFTKRNLESLAPFDFIFIDGGHDYLTVKSDFNLAIKVVSKRGIIALHDIYAEFPCEISKLWQEIKSDFSTHEFYDDSQTIKYGIGLVSVGIDSEFKELKNFSFRCN